MRESIKTASHLISCGGGQVVGLKADRRVVAVGKYGIYLQDWKLFNRFDSLKKELSKVKARLKAEAELEQAALQTELASLQGPFTGNWRREIEAKLAENRTEKASSK